MGHTFGKVTPGKGGRLKCSTCEYLFVQHQRVPKRCPNKRNSISYATPEEVERIVRLRGKGLTCKEIGAQVARSDQSVSKILRNWQRMQT